MQTGPKAEVGHPSSIAMAAAEGDTKRVQELLAQGASLSDQTFANCMTLLNTAAATGHTDLVEFLLTRGLNPNIPSSTGETALAMAVLCESADTVRILLEAGANPNAPNIEGWTPLHAAALSDNMEVMDMLLKHGGDPTIRNLAGQTPGAVARAEGHLKVANRLDSAASAWNR
jgi:ankyrin repeat protein